MERYRQYFQNLLTIQQPDNEEEAEIEREVNAKFESLLQTAKHVVPPRISSEQVLKAIKKMKRKKAGDRQGWMGEWLIEGGQEMIRSLVSLFNSIQCNFWIPQQWNSIKIKALHKKGLKKELSNKRGIFLAGILYKTFERVIGGRNEENIDKLLSVHQCGGRNKNSTLKVSFGRIFISSSVVLDCWPTDEYSSLTRKCQAKPKIGKNSA